MSTTALLVDVAVTPWWTLFVIGDLDLATGPDLDVRIDRTVAQHPGDGLILDLSEVTFMDCVGLHPIMRARNLLTDHLCLRGVHGAAQRLIELAGVEASLHILADGESPAHR
ncbi:MAG: STAS domain-containing protein [Kineosporiaceae bacterium]|nr:STAS domain-containing protein [Kineosporiaceae bacterium]MBK8075626.1 STAS domain-containing protein [Kineosporiaceae bacterium]